MKELKDLVGFHVLTGVDRGSIEVEDYGSPSLCETLSFTLDGVTYTACEDPQDGYRSSMRYLIQDGKTTNNFRPQKVVARMRQNEEWRSAKDEILELVDLATGKVVLEVGTNYYDDYYPCFVASFFPENMAINAGAGKGIKELHQYIEGYTQKKVVKTDADVLPF